MKRALRPWLLGPAPPLPLAAVAVVGPVPPRRPSDEEAAVRIAEAFEKRFGVGLEVGGAHWSLWPSPVLVLSDVATVQPRPVTLRRVTLQLRLRELLQRVVAVDELEVEGLVEKSPEGVVHLVARKVIDRSSELTRLSEDHDTTVQLARADVVAHPQPPRHVPHRHPRDVRILPGSRDFH